MRPSFNLLKIQCAQKTTEITRGSKTHAFGSLATTSFGRFFIRWKLFKFISQLSRLVNALQNPIHLLKRVVNMPRNPQPVHAALTHATRAQFVFFREKTLQL
jgi:hypothetical protein